MKTQTFRSILWVSLFYLIAIAGYADEGNFFARLDQDIFDAIYDEPPRSEPLGTAMEIGTYLGDGRTMLGVSLLLMAYGDDKNRETGRLLTSTFISTGVIVWGMKEIIGRKRPLDEGSVIRRFRRATPPTLSPVRHSLAIGIPSSAFRSISARDWSGSHGSISAGTTPLM